MEMIRGTTPTITCNCRTQNLDMTTCHGTIIKISQPDDIAITLSGNRLEITEHQIKCFLTQEQSLMLCEGEAEMQIHGLTESNSRWGTRPIPIEIIKTNHGEVIT